MGRDTSNPVGVVGDTEGEVAGLLLLVLVVVAVVFMLVSVVFFVCRKLSRLSALYPLRPVPLSTPPNARNPP